jgi:hypothetical protein
MSARITSAFQIYHKFLWIVFAVFAIRVAVRLYSGSGHLGEWLFVLFRPCSEHCRWQGHSILTEFRSPFAFRYIWHFFAIVTFGQGKSTLSHGSVRACTMTT